MFIETPIRSLAKTLSWRVTATVTTITLVYLFTGQIETALAVGSIEVVAKLIIFYLHERGWDKLWFGRKEVEPAVIWLTGYSGSGKGELGRYLDDMMKKRHLRVEFLNGEKMRDVIPNIGFSKEARITHIERVGYFANKLENNGVFVVASFISPDREARDFVRSICKNFVEVHVSTPLEVCEKRDKLGIYTKARNGELENVAGVHHPYEPSDNPEMEIDLSQTTVKEAAQQILKRITSQPVTPKKQPDPQQQTTKTTPAEEPQVAADHLI